VEAQAQRAGAKQREELLIQMKILNGKRPSWKPPRPGSRPCGEKKQKQRRLLGSGSSSSWSMSSSGRRF